MSRDEQVAACTCGWPEKACLRRALSNGPPFPPEPCEPRDPLLGPCERCGKVYAEHPGGFCPDQVDASGMVEVGNAAEFSPLA